VVHFLLGVLLIFKNTATASFEAFRALIFRVELFWVVSPCSVVLGYQHFTGSCCLHLQGKVGLWNNGILREMYTVSQPRRHRHGYRCCMDRKSV